MLYLDKDIVSFYTVNV